MPLTLANAGDKLKVKRVGGDPKTKKFLENLGFVTDADITVISFIEGNAIVNVKGTRIGISKEMAQKIIV
ncbi:MAG: FeoA family protein [Anaerovoracaceae bacterium]|jgi:ferrous iron transport protein A